MLKRKRYLARGEDGEWLLVRNLESTTLATLHNDLNLSLLPTDMSDLDSVSWGRRYSELAAEADQAQTPLLSISLRDLLGTTDGGEIIDLAAASGGDEKVESAP